MGAYVGPGTYVPGEGNPTARIMCVGERPGAGEAESIPPRPFVGPSGKIHDNYLHRGGINRSDTYVTNLVKTYIGGANPQPSEITRWEGELISEIARVQPHFVLSIGAFSTRWFLGEGVDMETLHGLPQRSRREGLGDAIVIPCYHPAYGLRDPEAASLVWFDYQQACKIIAGTVSRVPVCDEHPVPEYVDGGVSDLRRILAFNPCLIAEDTEGLVGSEWGFSISTSPGTGFVFRRSHPEFADVARLYREVRERRAFTSLLHNSMWDPKIERGLGMGSPVKVIDTMVEAFFLRVEPQALKTLAKRHCGMEMRTYEETIGDVAIEKQLTYLLTAADRTWDKPEPRLVTENDGSQRVYTPQGANQRIGAILDDFASDQTTDLAARWKAVDEVVRSGVERGMGESLPQATLDDIPRDVAIRYSGRDPDATLRVHRALRPRIIAMGLLDRLQLDLDIIPLFEEMQSTGIPASRAYFESLRDEMTESMDVIRERIQRRHGLERFNPMSQPQVSKLVASMGLRGVKRTKSGLMSTDKKSMTHLRSTNITMDDIFNWREHEKVRDSFAAPIIECIPDGVEYAPICCTIKITRVAQDRISASDPNLTAMPVASNLGRRVRDGFRIPDDVPEVFVTGDMSQIEMRVMADMSQDDRMCQFFRDGRDIHSETCIKIFGLGGKIFPVKDAVSGVWKYPGLDKNLRPPTKRAGFGVITGIQGKGLYDQLRLAGVDIKQFCATMGEKNPVKACDALIAGWFRVYPGCKDFLKYCGDSAYEHGFVRERGGFIRYLPSVWSVEEFTSAEARRQSHSHIISGTAQYMLRQGMRWLMPQVAALREESGLPCYWSMQIHDEVLFRCHVDLAPILQSLLYEALVHHSGGLSIPIDASTAVAKSWGSLEK